MVDPKLLEILVCPKCRGVLRQEEHPPRLLCDQCRLAYEVRDAIPIMLLDEAKPF
jgi:uncharacterized protein